MRVVSSYEAKTHLSAIVTAAFDGEDVVLARSGTPVVRLFPIAEPTPSDAFGIERARFVVPPDFDETPEDFDEYR